MDELKALHRALELQMIACGYYDTSSTRVKGQQSTRDCCTQALKKRNETKEKLPEELPFIENAVTIAVAPADLSWIERPRGPDPGSSRWQRHIHVVGIQRSEFVVIRLGAQGGDCGTRSGRNFLVCYL